MLETSDKIFLIKLWGKFGKNFQSPQTLYCLDDINMIQVIHQHSNFSSKFLYFFLSPNKRKKLTFFVMSFSSHFVHSTIFSTKFSKDQTEPQLPVGGHEYRNFILSRNFYFCFPMHNVVRTFQVMPD